MATGSPVGYLWLKQRYGLETALTHQSYRGTRLKTEIDDLGNITDIYPRTYSVEDTAMEHVEFGFKYDHLSLDLLSPYLQSFLSKRSSPTSLQNPKELISVGSGTCSNF